MKLFWTFLLLTSTLIAQNIQMKGIIGPNDDRNVCDYSPVQQWCFKYGGTIDQCLKATGQASHAIPECTSHQGDKAYDPSPVSQQHQMTEQTPALLLDIQQLMTAQEYSRSGLNKLNPEEKLALNRWLWKYSTSLIESGERKTSPVYSHSSAIYTGIGSGHWVRDKSDGGRFIILEDGSFWEISGTDRVDTALWLPITDITVIEARSPIGEFRYTLINTEDDEKALAQYLGKR